ncbi:inorganic triphosphatase [Vibrio palustris]|uniref:CYTH domain protein n=1 Tax=Vibrio palustris TaxID=1918946 RepID=A0A1R4B8Y4_9VIBR|nr:inorganic triphosphatase [Vibrio palustris]SJL85385.1 CYTH domain protein [Vibrio palustris]
METEIELKFFVSPEFADILREKISDARILQHSCRDLGNTYFDTPDNWLRNHDIGLRIRRYDDVYIQTVKTAGRVVAGLHQRPEYNAEHSGDDPDLTLHPDNIWPEGKTVAALQDELVPLFVTDFNRETWLVAMQDGSQIEIAFDSGVVSAGGLSEDICEVELELKSGQVDALFTLARHISEHGGMRLGNRSKAARGYRLAYQQPIDTVSTLQPVTVRSQDTVETCFIKSLEHALSHWQRHEQIYVEQDNNEALNKIRSSVCFIRQILTVFSSIVPRRASAILRQELKWLEDELRWLRDDDYLNNLLDDKGYALRKLDTRKRLVNELKELKSALPTRADTLALIDSSRYTALLLDLSRWILTRGWQPFLDEQAQENIDCPVTDFAMKQLDRSWAELIEAFPPEHKVTKQGYIEQQEHLTRNLYTGMCFCHLFTDEECQSFRLPWEDLLDGIDDLLMLQPIEGLVDKLEDSEQHAQLLRWITRQEHSILHAMDQSRFSGFDAKPYWRD